MSKRIIAKFHPQAWINDYAVGVDAEGPTEYDVTEDALATFTKDELLSMTDDSYDTDWFVYTQHSPKWIREWTGPFYIEIRDSIHDYFQEN